MTTSPTARIVRTTYVGPEDLPSGRTRGSRIRVTYNDGARKITRHIPINHADSDPHEAAVRSLFPAPASVVLKDWHNPYANESGTRQAWRVLTLPEGLTVDVEQSGGEGFVFRFAHWETPEDVAGGRATEWPNYRFTVTFSFAPTGRNLEVPFATGIGWDRHPTGPEVLAAYVSDAATVEQYDLPPIGHPLPDEVVREYARDMGADLTGDYAEDRRTLRQHRQILNTARKLNRQLSRLFGDYDAETRATVEGWEL